MIYLHSPSQKLQAVLAGAVAANQPEVSLFFFDHVPQATTTVRRGANKISTLNSTTDVDICDAPALQGIIRNIHTIIIYNKDTSAVTVTVKIDDGGTETILVKQTLAVGESMMYEEQRGWHGVEVISLPVTDTTEIIKGNVDTTKRIRMEADVITTGTTRVWTARDADFDIGAATQAEMEAGSILTASVTPGRQHYHPSAAKGWCQASVSGTINGSYNTTRVADNGAGDITFNWGTDFSGTNYCAIAQGQKDPGGVLYSTHQLATSFAAGATRAQLVRNDFVLIDPDLWMAVVLGDQ